MVSRAERRRQARAEAKSPTLNPSEGPNRAQRHRLDKWLRSAKRRKLVKKYGEEKVADSVPAEAKRGVREELKRMGLAK